MAEKGDHTQVFASEAELNSVKMHIEQDGAEKIEEIEIKSEEEFESEKFRIIMNQVHFIELQYKDREERVLRSVQVEYVALRNKSRMEHLVQRQEILANILREVVNKIRQAEQQQYKRLQESLILEGTYKILEPYIKVWCLPKDADLIENALKKVQKRFITRTGVQTELYIDRRNPISEDSEGGVILVNKRHTVSVCNTVASRVERTFHWMEPVIYYLLFRKVEKKERRFSFNNPLLARINATLGGMPLHRTSSSHPNEGVGSSHA